MLTKEYNHNENPEVPKNQIYHHTDFDYNPYSGSMTSGVENHSNLTKLEINLFEPLINKPNTTIEAFQLLPIVFGNHESLTTHLSKIRKKMGVGRTRALEILESVYGVGYRLNDDGKPMELPTQYLLNGMPLFLFEGKKEVVFDGLTLPYSGTQFDIINTLIKNREAPIGDQSLAKMSPPSRGDMRGLRSQVANINLNFKKMANISDGIIQRREGVGYFIDCEHVPSDERKLGEKGKELVEGQEAKIVTIRNIGNASHYLNGSGIDLSEPIQVAALTSEVPSFLIDNIYFWPDFTYNLEEGTFTQDGETIILDSINRRILNKLISSPNIVQDELTLLQGENLGSNQYLRTHIAEIRNQMPVNIERARKIIKTVRYVGYKFDDDRLLDAISDQPSEIVKRLRAGEALNLSQSKNLVPRLEEKVNIVEKRAVIENADPVLTIEKHAHHWLIDEANGPQSEAICKHCAAIKEFTNTPTETFTRAAF